MEVIEGGAQARTIAESKKEYRRVLAPDPGEGAKVFLASLLQNLL